MTAPRNTRTLSLGCTVPLLSSPHSRIHAFDAGHLFFLCMHLNAIRVPCSSRVAAPPSVSEPRPQAEKAPSASHTKSNCHTTIKSQFPKP